MRIGGFLKKSLIEYKGKISAVVFTMGCNMRCPFCHNPDLVNGTLVELDMDEIFTYLKKYRKWLDAVVVSGGEPTLHEGLPQFLSQLREMGFRIKIETNGTNPDMLQKLIEKRLVDFIQMDLKTEPVPQEYNKVCGTEVHFGKISRSVDLIKNSGLQHEFVTTLLPGMHSEALIKRLRTGFGVEPSLHRLQDFRSETVLDQDALNRLLEKEMMKRTTTDLCP